MILQGRPTRSIRRTEDGKGAVILDQRKLPWEVEWVELRDVDAAAVAIREMWTRGAPMIGATAAYGYAMALAVDPGDASLQAAYDKLHETRPTAINLRWALDEVRAAVKDLPEEI
ncbi:MAG TPA: S-methyl-5-thioribose-1-phosphate isomerase, partial [Sphingomonas sp.]|nr:S-methyl-5-thioribose-1-phosphate isomerase [Sphingomonas sp.]